MAIIKVNRSQHITAAVYEDPRPSSNRIYMFQDSAFVETTLDYVWNEGLTHTTAGTTPGGFGNPNNHVAGSSEYTTNGIMFLAGDVVHVNHVYTTANNERRQNLDWTQLASMDPANPSRNHRFLEFSATDRAIFTQLYSYQFYNSQDPYEVRYNPASDLTGQAPTKAGLHTTYGGMMACWLNPVTGRLVGVWRPGDNSANSKFAVATGNYRDIFTSGTTNIVLSSVNSVSYEVYQFIGVSNGGTAMFLRNSHTTDYAHIVYRYDDLTNTQTTMATLTAAPSAGGTSAGGNRALNFGSYIPKFSSKTFADPTSAGNVGWYTPYLDVNGKFHPFWYQWNKTTDTFTRNADITVNWGATNQDAVWSPDSVIGNTVDGAIAFSKAWVVETFVASGTRYLIFMQITGRNDAWDNLPRQRTFVTFSIDPTNPKSLTYHSSVTIPVTPKNFIWLNDSETSLGVITGTNFYIYNFSPANGWVLTSTLPYRFDAVGRDSLGRVWAVDSGPLQHGRVHLLAPSLPTTTTVTMAQTSYNYTGTTIPTTANVSTYDLSGSRIVSDLTLTVQGNSMKLVNSSNVEVNSLTLTTSASADVVANLRIISGGTSQLVASVNF
jgi:hypothetical protein